MFAGVAGSHLPDHATVFFDHDSDLACDTSWFDKRFSIRSGKVNLKMMIVKVKKQGWLDTLQVSNKARN